MHGVCACASGEHVIQWTGSTVQYSDPLVSAASHWQQTQPVGGLYGRLE